MNLDSMPSKRVAIIDVGSNAIKLLVAGKGKPLNRLHSNSLETRLSQGMGKGGKLFLSPKRMEASVKAICKLIEEARPFTPKAVRIYATSAVREAGNKQDFCARVRAATGIDLQVLSGEEEAFCVARGAGEDPALNGIHTFSLFDLGGGSLECIHSVKGKLKQAVSLPLGSVRLIEQFVPDPSAPLSRDATEKIVLNIKATVKKVPFQLLDTTLVGMGGSFTVARLLLAEQAWQALENTSPELGLIQLRDLFRYVARLSIKQRLRILKLSPGRADIFPVALLTMITLAEIAHQDRIIHSFFNLRSGLALKLLSELIQEEREILG